SPEPRIRALGRFERQDLFWTYAKGVIEGGYNFLTVEAYTDYGPLARVGFETRLWTPRVLLRVGWGFERVNFRKVNGAFDQGLQMALGVDRPERIGFLHQALVVDLRDHPIEPTIGAYAELHAAEGTPLAGSAYQYTSLVPDVRGYVPLFAGAVLAAH